MHYLDANKTAGEKARRQLHKNVASNIEQVLEATPQKHQLYSHLPPITKTIQVRRTRHAGHCWRSRDELISDVLLWTPTYGQAKAGRPARTYIQQLCEDTRCSHEDLPEAMNNRAKWRERVRDIRAGSMTSWWWVVPVYLVSINIIDWGIYQKKYTRTTVFYWPRENFINRLFGFHLTAFQGLTIESMVWMNEGIGFLN